MADTQFTSAHHFISDTDAAIEYLAKREDDLEKFMRALHWKRNNTFTIQTVVYGNAIVHELKPGALRAFPCWGELFWDEAGKFGKEDPVIFDTFHNFAAFVLARWW
jgi:hypothetical protein